jgi:AraC-like DNA-binding protein
MSVIFEERPSDSPYVENVTQGWTARGSTIRPSEIHWHMIFVKLNGLMHPIVTGPLTASGQVDFVDGAEILWIKFRLGTFMPSLPMKNLLDKTIDLPEGAGRSFWLNSSTWQYPTFHNVETLVDRLVREDALVCDPVVSAALLDHPMDMSPRTLRHRFMQSTGLTHKHIRQYQRAQQANHLLQRGVPILDTVYEMGYFDQPHLTRALKRFVGRTPAQQYVRICQPE